MAAFTEEEMKGFSMQGWYDLDGEVAIVTGGRKRHQRASQNSARRYATISMTSQIRSMPRHW